MATTYNPIATTTLSSAAKTIVFSSIPGTYTDLFLVVNVVTSASSSNIRLFFNTDTSTSSTNYGAQHLATDVATNVIATGNYLNTYGMWTTFKSATAAPGSGHTFYLPSYTSTSMWKTCLTTSALKNTTGAYGGGGSEFSVGSWINTAAIDTLTLDSDSGTALGVGTTATIYGILAA